MRNRVPHLFFASILLSALGAACNQPGTGTTGGNGDTGAVVLGIKSKLMVSDANSMHVTIKAGGKVVLDKTQSGAKKDLHFPTELRVNDLEDGERVEAEIDYLTDGSLLITREAATDAVAGKVLLLATELESSCTLLGGFGPSCDGPQTCVHGACRDSYVAPSQLPEYTPTWATTTTDVCKPQGAGDPIVVVGEGQADYLPMADGDLAQVEAGPQGGHHIWVAVRMKNLTQSGSITSLTGHIADLGYDVGPFNVIFTFDPDEGGYCKIYGLRFQLDTQHDINEMLGHTLELTATITDKDKTVGAGKRTVVLSKDILGN